MVQLLPLPNYFNKFFFWRMLRRKYMYEIRFKLILRIQVVLVPTLVHLFF